MTQLSGTKELLDKLNAIGGKVGRNALRSAVRKAVAPVVLRMKSSAPVGNQAHRTHKGRLVAPGFLARSIRTIVKVDNAAGTVAAVIGARKEAFYGVQFFDQGPTIISQRRVKPTSRSVVYRGKLRKDKRNIQPYTLRKVPFFQSVFVSNRTLMENSLVLSLKTVLEKAARGN